jgi:hypothetical protein
MASSGRTIPEDAILHSHCRENLKSYMWGLLCTKEHWEGFLQAFQSPLSILILHSIPNPQAGGPSLVIKFN